MSWDNNLRPAVENWQTGLGSQAPGRACPKWYAPGHIWQCQKW